MLLCYVCITFNNILYKIKGATKKGASFSSGARESNNKKKRGKIGEFLGKESA